MIHIILFFGCLSLVVPPEPADAVQPGTPGVDQAVECFLLVRFKRFIVTEFPRDFSAAEYPVPALDNTVARGSQARFPVNV